MGDRYSSFAVNENNPLNTELGFLALTVIIDNLTSSFIDMRGVSGRFIPPWTYGATVPLGAGTQVASILWATPPGVSAATVGTGQANVVYTSAQLPASSGRPVVVPTSQTVPLTVQSVITPPGAGGHAAAVGAQLLPIGVTSGQVGGTYAMLLPAATETIMVAYGQTGISTGSCIVQVIGVQTNMLYGTVNMSGGGPPQYVAVTTGADVQVAILIGAVTAPNSGDYIEVIAMPFPETVSIIQNSNGVLNDNISQVGGIAVPVASGALGSRQATVPTSNGPNTFIQTANINVVLVAGGDATIVPADFSLRSVYLGRFRLTVQGTPGSTPVCSLRAGAAGPDFAGFGYSTPATTSYSLVCDTHFDFAPVTASGVIVALHNYDSVTHTFEGFVQWQWW